MSFGDNFLFYSMHQALIFGVQNGEGVFADFFENVLLPIIHLKWKVSGRLSKVSEYWGW